MFRRGVLTFARPNTKVSSFVGNETSCAVSSLFVGQNTTMVAISQRTYSSKETEQEIEKILQAIKKNGLENKLTLRSLAQLKKKSPETEQAMSVVGDLAAKYISQHPERAGTLPPVRVAITGAAGAIGYSLVFRIASGEMLGPHQPVVLQLLEIPQGLKALEGVAMELQDCAFPLLRGLVTTDDPNKAFDGADYALLVGAKPRTKGMERADLLKENANIFSAQGKALDKHSNREDLKVVVVGNPANTNALIASCNAPNIHPSQFTAMTKLDHNRALAQLAIKTGCQTTDIERLCIWGNHSSTQYPDVSHTQIKGKWAKELVDEKWVKDTFIPTVQQRGAAIIAARGSSSAASAANAAIEHMRDWVHGTNGQWTSMGVWTGDKKSGPYGTSGDIYYSFPVVCEDGEYTIVQNVPIDPFSADRMTKTNEELVKEKADVGPLASRK